MIDIPMLTPPETEIIEWVLEGKTCQQIARELFVAKDTIKRCVSSIVSKIGVFRFLGRQANRKSVKFYFQEVVKTMQAVFDLKPESPSPDSYKFVLMCLVNHANNAHIAAIDVSDIARLTSASEEAVEFQLSCLTQDGIIMQIAPTDRNPKAGFLIDFAEIYKRASRFVAAG